MGIATGTPIGLGNYTGPFTATKGPSARETYPKTLTTENISKPETASHKPKRSFFVGFAQDLIKTTSRVIWGGMLSDTFNGVLKDEKFHLPGVIHSQFVEGLGSRLGADLIGAVSERLFNGETRLFGINFPKIPSEIASQLSTNLWVKGWRMVSNGLNLNRLTAERDQSPDVKKLQEYFMGLPWVKFVNKANKIFSKTIQPILEKTFGFVFGVKGGEKYIDESGKKRKGLAQVNYKQLGLVSVGSLVATALLPRDTQAFGNSGIHNAKGFWRSLFRFCSTFLMTFAGRLEGQFFRNVLSLNQNGYSPDACLKTTVREKMLVPFVQAVVDSSSALITRFTKFLPVNGAFLSTIMRIPSEAVATLLSSGLTGLSGTNRVPPAWNYLGVKYWKPIAKALERVSKPLLDNTVNIIYRMLGMLPSEEKMGLKYREYAKEQVGEEELLKYKNNSLWNDIVLLIKEANPVSLWKTATEAFKDAYEHGKDAQKEIDKKRSPDGMRDRVLEPGMHMPAAHPRKDSAQQLLDKVVEELPVALPALVNA